MSSAPARLCAGLMSGTSVDAVDGVLAAFPLPPALESGHRPGRVSTSTSIAGLPRTLAFRSRVIPEALRNALQALQHPGSDELARAALAANALAELYAQVLADLLEESGHKPADIAAVGAHGQTVRHRPELGYTLQLLNPALLAERCGISVVADLRSADVAARGQGAPLAPGFHAEVFASPDRCRAIVNLGGIANVSLIAPRDGHVEGRNSAPAVLGCDTGPANALLDLWCERHTGAPFDAAGAWAAGGRVDEHLLARLLQEPYFSLPAPKSTGRDLFEARWLERALSDTGCTDAAPRDVQATLAELTAITVARPCCAFGAEELWVCGGGVRNADLMRRIARQVEPAPVAGTDGLGIDPQAVEACAFAWLAHRHLCGLPGNLTTVTGATGRRVLGALWPAPLRA